MNKVLERLIQFIDFKKISYHAFDVSIGASNGYIGKQIKNNGSIGSNIVEKIHQVYPELSLNWLFTGGDKMIKGYSIDESLSNVVEDSEEETIYKNSLFDKILIEIKELKKEISTLNKQLSDVNQDKEVYKMLLEEAKLDKEIYRKIADQKLGLKNK